MTKTDSRIHPIGSDEAFEASARILCQAFGARSYTAESLSRQASEENVLMLGASVTKGGVTELVCVGMADREPSISKSFSAFDANALKLLSRHRVGHLFSMAVEPSHRARGIGKQATRKLLAWLLDAGCDLAVAASWASGGNDQSGPALERLGFRSISRVPGEAYRVNALGCRSCPSCGIPCGCFGVLFVRELFNC